MPVMDGADRLELIFTLEKWYANAQAGIKCSADVTPGMIGLIKRASDKPDPPAP